MHRALVTAEPIGHVDEHGRAYRHEGVGAQAGCALTHLALEADQPAPARRRSRG